MALKKNTEERVKLEEELFKFYEHPENFPVPRSIAVEAGNESGYWGPNASGLSLPPMSRLNSAAQPFSNMSFLPTANPPLRPMSNFNTQQQFAYPSSNVSVYQNNHTYNGGAMVG